MMTLLALNSQYRNQSRFWDFIANLGCVLGMGLRQSAYAGLRTSEGNYVEAAPGRAPYRGLLYSFLVHEIAVSLIVCLPGAVRLDRRFYVVERWDLRDNTLVYPLPPLGGGHEGGGGREGKSSSGVSKAGVPLPEPGGKSGPSFPGPQPIISNPARPMTRIQTILQPDLPHPSLLQFPLPLPNMVLLGPPPPLPHAQAPPKKVASALPPPQPPDPPNLESTLRMPDLPFSVPPPPWTPPVAQPKMDWPPSAARDTRPPVSAETTPPEPPKLTPDLSSARGGLQNLLVLSPLPSPPDPSAKVPPAEARAQFSIGPDAGLQASSQLGSGSTLGSTASAGVVAAPDTGQTGSTSGSGSMAQGPSDSRGGIDGGGVSGGGQGMGVGNGKGEGGGAGLGIGQGAGLGPGTGPFPGISIIGGSEGSGGALGRGARPAPSPRHGTYDLTIVSTASSGGGLRDYGVFREEAVFTVFIDMESASNNPDSWIMQFALLPRMAGGAGAMQIKLADPPEPRGQLVSPFPLSKTKPQISEEVAAKALHGMLVVYGVVNPAGKLENMRVIESPDPLLSSAVLTALEKWIFQPAELNGEPVAVKALLGIPLPLRL